jgi:TrkA domain protein
VELQDTLLPGVGVRYELTARSGERLGVVVQREGGAELAVSDRHDPTAPAGCSGSTREGTTPSRTCWAPCG